MVLEKGLQVGTVHSVFNRLGEARTNLGLIAVSDRLNEKFAKGSSVELELTKNVENLSSESGARFFEFFEEASINISFSCLVRNEIPKVADLCLTDAVDTAKALLKAIRIPRQIIVHHEVGPLKVDALAGGIGGEQDLNFRVVEETVLGLSPVLAANSAMDHDDGSRPSKEVANLPFEIVQGVTVLSEDDDLLPGRGSRLFDRSGTIGLGVLGDPITESSGRKDLPEELG